MNKIAIALSAIVIALIAVLSLLAFSNHATLTQIKHNFNKLASANPEVIYLPVKVEKPVMIEKTKPVETPLETDDSGKTAAPVEIPRRQRLTTFTSLEELESFVDDWVFRGTFVDGQFTFGGEHSDCDDFAIQFMEDIVNAGYIAGIVLDPIESHLLNTIPIGNCYYFVDATNKSIKDSLNGKRWLIDRNKASFTNN